MVRRDAASIGLYYFAGDMSDPDYNNPLTRMIFDRVQKSPAALQRMAESLMRERGPFDVLKPTTLLRWLLAESIRGNLAPWASLGRNVRLGMTIAKQQAILDRALARAERDDLDGGSYPATWANRPFMFPTALPGNSTWLDASR
jgi:hypothetical protein